MIDHAREWKFHSIEFNPDKNRVEICLENIDRKKNALQFVPLKNENLLSLIQESSKYLNITNEIYV